MPRHEHATRITAELLRVVDHPRDGRAHLRDDLVEPRRRRQRVFHEGQVEPGVEDALAQEGVRLLVVHLPVAAVDVHERRRRRHAAVEDVEALPRTRAVADVDRAAPSLPEPVAAGRPVCDVPIARGLAHGGGVVVRGIERHPVHASVEHRQPRSRAN